MYIILWLGLRYLILLKPEINVFRLIFMGKNYHFFTVNHRLLSLKQFILFITRIPHTMVSTLKHVYGVRLTQWYASE